MYLEQEIRAQQGEEDDSRTAEEDQLEHGEDEPGQQQTSDTVIMFSVKSINFLPYTTTSSDQQEKVQEDVSSSTGHHGQGAEDCILSQRVETALQALQGGESYRLLVILHQ